MGKIYRYRTALARHHRSRGFGIHSPFAFHFVTQVLRERLPYYAYEAISLQRRNAAKATRHGFFSRSHIISTAKAQLLFRITNCFNPAAIIEFGAGHGVTETSLLSVSSSSRLYIHGNGNLTLGDRFPNKISINSSCQAIVSEFLADTGSTAPLALVNAVSSPSDYPLVRNCISQVASLGGVIIIRHTNTDKLCSKLWQDCKPQLSAGQTFSNGQTAILVCNPKLKPEHFSLWF